MRSRARRPSGTANEDAETLSVRLLADLRALFERERADRLPSDRICEALVRDPEAPWGDLGRGERLTPRRLARMLAPFGVRPDRTRDWRGYTRDAFGDAWDRYLPPSPSRSVTSVTAASNGRETHFSQASQTPLCDTLKNSIKPAWNKARDACDALIPQGGDEITDHDPEVPDPLGDEVRL